MLKKITLVVAALCLLTLGACAKSINKDYTVPVPAPIETQMVK